MQMFRTRWLTELITFLDSVGIQARSGSVDITTPFSGVLIDHGTLVLDEDQLMNVGDALHEAAHIAVAPVSRRPKDFGWISAHNHEELATIAWCWAAVCHLSLPAKHIFASDAFRQAGGITITKLARQHDCPGVVYLAQWGMTIERRRHAVLRGLTFPRMISWVRISG
jgi:hypothetical protein